MPYIALTQNKIAIVSDEDFVRVSAYKWYYTAHRSGYAFTHIAKKTVYMHRFIIDAAKGIEVDHIDGDTLNNIRANLRSATRRENAQNQKKHQRKASRSLYKGVYKHTDGDKWSAQIRANGQDIRLGTFITDREAAQAYDKAAMQYFGEFARLNFP